MKGKQDYIKIIQFITSSTGLRPYNLTMFACLAVFIYWPSTREHQMPTGLTMGLKHHAKFGGLAMGLSTMIEMP